MNNDQQLLQNIFDKMNKEKTKRNKISLICLFVIFLLAFICFNFASYEQNVVLARISLIIKIYFAIPFVFFSILNSIFSFTKGNDNKITLFFYSIVLFFLFLSLITFLSSPIEKMSEKQKNALPCLGEIDDENKNNYLGFPEFNEKCTSVIHDGHGAINKDGEHRIMINGADLSTSKLIHAKYFNARKYAKVKRVYIVSCRGINLSLFSAILSFSFSFIDEREIELQDGKEIVWFAKKGNLLIFPKSSPWIDWSL